MKSAADDQILEAYQVVDGTVVVGISYPKEILLYCEPVNGKSGVCWALRTGSQPDQKVKLQTTSLGT